MHIYLNVSPPKQSQLGLSDTVEGNTLQHESKTDTKHVNGTFFVLQCGDIQTYIRTVCNCLVVTATVP